MLDSETSPADRFGPHAVRELGGMFGDVSPRYDLLNSVLSLGQDRAWRTAMWRAVPEAAHTVLDLCTGSGVSLPGLRRPGRLVLGVDVSLPMLAIAAGRLDPIGWAPRLVGADGFRLPFRTGRLDAVTIAFGIRNLRPMGEALRELHRVLRPGGTLVVLEATAPGAGPPAALHRFYLRRLVPLAGRLSPDPSAYDYLSRSIFEFGSGPEFEKALGDGGFTVVARRRFLAGATRLWVASRSGDTGQESALSGPERLQFARPGGRNGVNLPSPADPRDAEWRTWMGVQLVLAVALTASFAYALWILANSGSDLPLAGWHWPAAWLLVVGGLVGFALRAVILALRFLGPRTRR